MLVEVRVPVTGNVWKIEKSVGDVVAEGDVVMILESMKMEIPVESPDAGTIESVWVSEGAAVDEDAIVAMLRVG